MGMLRGGTLVATVARVVELTGRTDLANLETSGELDLDDLLVTANDWVYDKIEGAGHDPTALSNQTRYERAVAWYLLSVLAEQGHLGDDPELAERLEAKAEKRFDEIRPLFANADDPRTAGEAIPHVKNMRTDPLFGSTS